MLRLLQIMLWIVARVMINEVNVASETNKIKINYTVTSLIASVQQNQQYENDVFGEIGAVGDSQSISSIALYTKIPWLLRGYRWEGISNDESCIQGTPSSKISVRWSFLMWLLSILNGNPYT